MCGAGLGDLPVRLDRGVCMPVPILLQPADPRGQFVPLSGDVRGPPVRPVTRKTGAGGERGHLPG